MQHICCKVDILEGHWFWYFFLTLESSLKIWCVPHILFCAHQSLNSWFDTLLYSPRLFCIAFSIVDTYLEHHHVQIDVLSMDFWGMF